jgi:hypothetical protein
MTLLKGRERGALATAGAAGGVFSSPSVWETWQTRPRPSRRWPTGPSAVCRSGELVIVRGESI